MRRQLLLLFVALAWVLSAGCDRALFGEKTQYSSGYSDRMFGRVKAGMTIHEVVSLLGKPLAQTTQEWSEVWIYDEPTHEPTASRRKFESNSFNMFGRATTLKFTRSGNTANVSGDYLEGQFLGLTRQEVRARVGEPTRRELTQPRIIYRYTLPSKEGSGTYKRREVHFDETGRVSSLVAAVYYD